MAELFGDDVDIEAELAKEEVDTPEIQEAPAEPIVEAKTDAAAEAPPTEPVEEKRPEKMVSLNALHESRIKEREARARADAIERESAERFKKLEERLNLLANPPPAVPRFEDDPANHLKHQVEAVRQEFAPMKEQLEQFQSRDRQAEVERNISAKVSEYEVEFTEKQPDYLDAVAHFQKTVDANLTAMGITDPAQRASQIRTNAMNLAMNALKVGKSPAELVYAIARNTGYTPTQVKNDSSAETKIATIEKGKAATPSMPSGGKVAPTLSLQALESMDDDEFNKMIDDPAAWKKLMRDAK